MSAPVGPPGELRTAYVKGIAAAQRTAREVILCVAETVQVGQSEREVCARLEQGFARAGVRHWLHTPYAWWGERTRFDWAGVWETNALPSDRRLQPGESFVLDAAPIVAGFPSDFAYSGVAPGNPSATAEHAALLAQLAHFKRELVTWRARPRAVTRCAKESRRPCWARALT